jgi:hypothetical protein
MAAMADDNTQDAILAALNGLGRNDPQVLAALQSKEAGTRAVAAITLGRLRQPAIAAKIRPLLNDPAPPVRYAAALGLLACGERQAAETLAALLDQPDRQLVWKVNFLLFSLADERITKIDRDDFPQQYREACIKWCHDHADKLDLSHLDDFLPGQSRPARLRMLALGFSTAWHARDVERLNAMSSLPFLVAATEHHDENWSGEFFAASASSAAAAPYFRFLRIVPVDRLPLLSRSQFEMDFAQRHLTGKDDCILLYAPSPDTWGAMLIRNVEGRLRVAGITSDRDGAPPRKLLPPAKLLSSEK